MLASVDSKPLSGGEILNASVTREWSAVLENRGS
jgi:hypothetical protein